MFETSVNQDRLSKTLLFCCDSTIAGLVFLLPFLMGGREAWGHWFLISSALLLGVCWCAWAARNGCRYRTSWLELFFLTGLGLAAFQTLPQTRELLSAVSPEYERLLPTWAATQSVTDSPSSAAQSWSTISLTPVETQHAWWVFLAYAVITTVLFQRINSRRDCHAMLRWVAVGGLVMTLFSVVQWVTSNGRFFWFYEHPYTDPTAHLKGAFTNRNHFAQFLTLSLGPLLWWLMTTVRRVAEPAAGNSALAAPAPARDSAGRSRRSRSRSKSRALWKLSGRFVRTSGHQQDDSQRLLNAGVVLLLIAFSVVAVAVLMSLSRGGILAAVIAVLTAIVCLWRSVKVGGAMAGLVIGGSALFLTMLALTDQEQVQIKLDQLLSGDAEAVDANGNRRAVWAADARVIERFPILGTGVGSHRDVYAIYMDNYAD
ncbi:MAG: O-antigen ligase family protein, partial [Planctomycetaceae bacterium]|nr:O-antigen ligase family protein [Planctomycetaceae bacterium]